MSESIDLQTYLDRWAASDLAKQDIAKVVLGMAHAGGEIARVVGLGALAGPLGEPTGKKNGVHVQKQIDLIANGLVIAAMKSAPVAAVASEELEAAVAFDRSAPLIIAVDPLDGSANIDTNASVGTIFSILPSAPERANGTECSRFLQPGVNQLAAGMFIYGPQTLLVLTLGRGTQVFTYDWDHRCFGLTLDSVEIPPRTREYAINASNHRHWDQPIRTYVDDCLTGVEGPRREDFNMRWIGSPVAEIYRIVSRGGIYLYPGDNRPGFQHGRMRLLYEANPIAFLVEQAGGAASTGVERILNLIPESLHQRVPLIVGSRQEVEYVVRLHHAPHADGERSPLFSRRGLFRT
jgi:fructose-1,6-bisphosphatase I